MKRHSVLRCGAITLALALAGPAAAQSLKQLEGVLGGSGHGASTDSGSSGGATSALGDLASGNLKSGSLGNATGVLQYCIKNNYLSGNGVTSLKDKLTSRITGSSGQPAEKNDDYLSGAKGLLKTGDGKSVDLSGSGLKEQVTKKACDAVLAQAKGFL
ncbi:MULTISPECIES: DUF2501 domain-containing protein [unclassified Achromobacter]|jgi:hypothetical protein|uniref:DUF2501 domain-containing protein n=1 Tax=unclassified Achromobacter TaxID=2626865 RepID=UPI000B51C7DC|nr:MULTISPECIES: DUF2501 domain-containing protein [unclassified Achromobacter]OWT73414.1 hypothetical protein CEY05_20000 [Achromobacter sp. HZ34]OWT79669.1 hypothetical protein CEY04_11980 [Achromobacter sp. HZ28]